MKYDSGHPDIGPELRRLAQAVLDRLDPALRAAAMAATVSAGPGRCQQVWCPVCALAALVSGEQHPLLTVIAEHSIALMTVITAMVADVQMAGAQKTDAPAGTPAPPADGDLAPPAPGTASGEPGTPGRYQHIPIVVESVVADD